MKMPVLVKIAFHALLAGLALMGRCSPSVIEDTVPSQALYATEVAAAAILTDSLSTGPTKPILQSGVTPVSILEAPSVLAISTPVVKDAELTRTDTFDMAGLGEEMLALINQDRIENGLAPVAWDETAALVGQLHAEDMLNRRFFSHWNPEGLGPDHRYARLGGAHVVMENIYRFSYTSSDGSGAPIANWSEKIMDAQTSLMQSPGHRANILDAAHTHVGIGLAYDSDRGVLQIAQEFTNHYVDLTSALPSIAQLGETVRIAGTFRNRGLQRALLDVAYETFPTALDSSKLAATNTYSPATQSIYTRAIDLVFDETIDLGDEATRQGLYHIRLFVDLPSGQAQVLNHIVEVR